MQAQTQVSTNDGETFIRSGILIGKESSEIWKIISNLENIALFHPLIRSAHYTSAERQGIGAMRECRLLPFGSLAERIAEWEDEQFYTVEVVGGSMKHPMRYLFGRLSLQETAEGTVAEISFHYRMKFGPMGKLMDRLMIRPQFRKAAPVYVGGLKYFCETGRVPTAAEAGT